MASKTNVAGWYWRGEIVGCEGGWGQSPRAVTVRETGWETERLRSNDVVQSSGLKQTAHSRAVAEVLGRGAGVLESLGARRGGL